MCMSRRKCFFFKDKDKVDNKRCSSKFGSSATTVRWEVISAPRPRRGGNAWGVERGWKGVEARNVQRQRGLACTWVAAHRRDILMTMAENIDLTHD